MKPTIGQLVHYFPWNQALSHFGPLAALVTHVHSERRVNLCVFSSGGVPFPEREVAYVQVDEFAPADLSYCRPPLPAAEVD